MKKEQNQKQREQETERKLDLLLKNDYTNDGNEVKKKKSSFNLRKKEKDKVPLLEDSSYFTSLQESDVLPTHKSASGKCVLGKNSAFVL